MLLRSPDHAMLQQLLRRSNCVLYPPIGEHFGIVPVEGMAAGKPVIASNSGGPTETIIDGESGLLCEPTPEAFAGAIARLQQNPQELHGMGENARIRANRFSLDTFAQELNSALIGLVQRQ